VGDLVDTAIDTQRREKIRQNHSATHLLHAALRNVLGKHVQQKGSLVNEEKLRFDFSHSQAVDRTQMQVIEDQVNQEIRRNTEAKTDLLPYEEAVQRGAMALFGEKYAEQVRVLTMGEGYSVELCGGTHVSRTGDIGLFRITSEAGIASGVRRIEAVTGAEALAQARASDWLLDELASTLRGQRADVLERVLALAEENKQLQKQLSAASQKLAASAGSDLANQVELVGGVEFLAGRLMGDGKAMMQTLDTLRSQISDGIIVLACVDSDKVSLVVGVGKGLTDRVKAPDILAVMGPLVGAKGGGRPDMARAGGGKIPSGIDQALVAARNLVSQIFGA